MTVPFWLAPLFFLAAVVLDIFALIAAASDGGTCLGSSWYVWTSATVLALLAWVATYPRNRVRTQQGTVVQP